MRRTGSQEPRSARSHDSHAGHPSRRVRMIAIWDTVTYEVFTGVMLGWPPEKRARRGRGLATLRGDVEETGP